MTRGTVTITKATIIIPHGTSYSTVPLIKVIMIVIIQPVLVAVKVRAKKNSFKQI